MLGERTAGGLAPTRKISAGSWSVVVSARMSRSSSPRSFARAVMASAAAIVSATAITASLAAIGRIGPSGPGPMWPLFAMPRESRHVMRCVPLTTWSDRHGRMKDSR